MSENSLVRLIPALARCQYDRATDGELVDSYTQDRTEAAFVELMRRHGSMVLSVCRRILRNAADVDDVFQATFLVLARKSGAIHPAGAVGAWLHGVAFRTAREALRQATRRRVKESRVVPREQVMEEIHDDLRQVLDAELHRLPEKYVQVLILCDMEGRTRREVAELCGVPEGTIASRLSRAREMLATRLTRQGRELTAGVVIAAMAVDAGAVPPHELLTSTAQAATAFVAGRAAGVVSGRVLELANTILGTFALRLKLFGAVLVVVAATVTAWSAEIRPFQQLENPTTDPATHEPSSDPIPTLAVRELPHSVRDQLVGQWQVDSGTRNGRSLTDWERQGFQFRFDASGALTTLRGQIRDQRAFTWAIDPVLTPPTLVLAPPGGNKAGSIRVACEFKNNSLILAWDEPASGMLRGKDLQPTACKVTLSKTGTAANQSVLAVSPSPLNAVGQGLAGSWEADDELNRRLGLTAGRGNGDSGGTILTFSNDPTVASELPAAYREAFVGTRIYLAGRMTVKTKTNSPTSYCFLLIEQQGNPLLTYFIPRPGNEWGCDEAVRVVLVPGVGRDRDVLFLSEFETTKHSPVGGFRRVVGKK